MIQIYIKDFWKYSFDIVYSYKYSLILAHLFDCCLCCGPSRASFRAWWMVVHLTLQAVVAVDIDCWYVHVWGDSHDNSCYAFQHTLGVCDDSWQRLLKFLCVRSALHDCMATHLHCRGTKRSHVAPDTLVNWWQDWSVWGLHGGKVRVMTVWIVPKSDTCQLENELESKFWCLNLWQGWGLQWGTCCAKLSLPCTTWATPLTLFCW